MTTCETNASSRGVMKYHYKEAVMAELIHHGVYPRPETPPDIVRDFLFDLYGYEIRKLRDRMRAGLIPKHEYAEHVIRLRKRYPILSLPLGSWTDE